MQRARDEGRRWQRRDVLRLGAAGAVASSAATLGRAGEIVAQGTGTQGTDDAGTGALLPLRVALSDAPSTLDPQRAFAPIDRLVVRQLWEPLFRFGAEPDPLPAAAQDARPEAGAARWWFTLRPDLRWPGGAPLQAEDFVRGWRRVISPEVPDELFAPFRPIRAAGVVRVGVVAPDALGLRAPDPDTITIELDGPAAHFRHVAALWLGAPAALAGQTAGGNGPFLLEGWDAGGLRLRPNPSFQDGPPATPVSFVTGRDAVGAALSDLAAAEPDARTLLADVVPVPDDLAGDVLADPRLAAQVIRQVRPATHWLTCNVTRTPLDRPLVRKALAAAVDREAYVHRALGGAGLPAYSLLPPGCPGHDPAAGTAYRTRPEVALSFLSAAGIDPAALATLRLTVPATAKGREAGTAVLDGLERHLGVRPALAEIDRYAYVRVLEQRRFDLAVSGWESPYPDPEGWFWLPFGAGKAENRTGWESRALDALWQEADAVTDPPARLALYAAAQQTLLEDMPVIFLAHPLRLAVAHGRVAGLTPSVMDELTGAAALRDVRLLA